MSSISILIVLLLTAIPDLIILKRVLMRIPCDIPNWLANVGVRVEILSILIV